MKNTLFLFLCLIMLAKPLTAQSCFPYQPTNLPNQIVLTHVTFNGLPISPGDEVGVFDEELCVGAAHFEGLFNWHIPIWENDMTNNLPGFTNGHLIGFQFCEGSDSNTLDGYPIFETGGPNFNDNAAYCVAMLAISETGFVTGDVNQDDLINVTDLTYLLIHLLKFHSLTAHQGANADMNQDHFLNILDVIQMVNIQTSK